MHRGMADMMKAMGGAKRGPLAGIGRALGFGGGGMPQPTPEMLEEFKRKGPAAIADKLPELPKDFGKALPGGLPGGPTGLPGLPGRFPGLPFGTKKK